VTDKGFSGTVSGGSGVGPGGECDLVTRCLFQGQQ